MYSHLWGFFLAVPRFSLRVHFCKSWCFLQTGDAVIEGACMLIFTFFLFSCCLSPLNSTDYCWSCVCACVRALLGSNNCGCV